MIDIVIVIAIMEAARGAAEASEASRGAEVDRLSRDVAALREESLYDLPCYHYSS